MKVAIIALGSVSSDTAGRTYLSELLGPLGDQSDLDVTVHLADPDFAVPESCRVRRYRLPSGPEPIRKVLAEAWLARRLSNADYDVLLAPFNFLPVTWRGRSVVVQHNVLSFERRVHGQTSGVRAWYRPRALAVSIKRATVVVTVSEYLKRLLLERFPQIDPARVHVVPYGVSLGRAAVPTAQASPDPRVLVVSALWPYKRVDQAIEAFAHALGGSEAGLLEVAGPAPARERAPLEELARELGVAARVRFLGNLDHPRLAEHYAAADAVLYLSEIESFGLPLLEAMAAGVPVIAKRIEGLVEVGADVPVWVEPNARASEIGATLTRVLSDRRLQDERRDAGLLRSREFTPENTAELTAECLRSAAVGRQPLRAFHRSRSDHFSQTDRSKAYSVSQATGEKSEGMVAFRRKEEAGGS